MPGRGFALFAEGPLSGTFLDSSGAQLSYCIRSASGSVEDFSADMDVFAGGYSFKAVLEFSRERGTRLSKLLMRPPDDEAFEDVTRLASLCSVQYFTDFAVSRGFGYVASDCLAHAISVFLCTNGLPDLPEACRVEDGVLVWPTT